MSLFQLSLLIFILFDCILAKPVILQNNHLKIVTTNTIPYIYYNDTTGIFTGFLVDLVDRIFEVLNTSTTYEFYIVPDGNYGKQYPNGSWDGMVREIIDGTADLAVADFTITSDRYKGIDFTYPFLDIGLSLLVYDDPPVVDIWGFLSPFTTDLWGALISTCLIVSLFIWAADKISPYGYHHSKLVSEVDRFNYSSAFLSSLLIFVGSDGDSGRSWSSKIILFGYLTFTLIILSFYGANLSAAITVQRASSNIHGLDDLKVSNVKFGVQSSTSIEAYFEQSSMGIYKRHMVLYPDFNSELNALEDGSVDTIVNDSPTQEYQANRPPCNKFMVGSIFQKSNFGIGLSKGNNDINVQLSIAILQLRQNGELSSIYNNWWSIGQCPTPTEGSEHLQLTDLFGAFALLGIGLILAIITLIFENVFFVLYHNQCPGGCCLHVHKCLGFTEEEVEIAIEKLLKSPDSNPVAKSSISSVLRNHNNL